MKQIFVNSRQHLTNQLKLRELLSLKLKFTMICVLISTLDDNFVIRL